MRASGVDQERSTASSRTWDLTLPGTGVVDYAFSPKDKGQRATITLFTVGGRLPQPGDAVIIPHHKDRRPGAETARYRVVATRRPSDPGDMGFCDLEFWPRKANVDA
jgi:hypothetical protein